jgi:hypothetical protein
MGSVGLSGIAPKALKALKFDLLTSAETNLAKIHNPRKHTRSVSCARLLKPSLEPSNG